MSPDGRQRYISADERSEALYPITIGQYPEDIDVTGRILLYGLNKNGFPLHAKIDPNPNEPGEVGIEFRTDSVENLRRINALIKTFKRQGIGAIFDDFERRHKPSRQSGQLPLLNEQIHFASLTIGEYLLSHPELAPLRSGES